MRAVIFGSSAVKEHEQEYKDAYEIAKILAKKGYIIVNGGYSGVMEAVSKGAKDAGGKSVGITVKRLSELLSPNEHLSEEIETENLFERLKEYIKEADLFIVFPGGSGTLTELLLVMDLTYLKMIEKKPIILYTDFWKPVLAHIEPRMHPLKIKQNTVIIHNIDEFKEFLEKIFD